jgi:hypothetical protein
MRWARQGGALPCRVGPGGQHTLPGGARPGQGGAGPGSQQALLGGAGPTAGTRGQDRAGVAGVVGVRCCPHNSCCVFLFFNPILLEPALRAMISSPIPMRYCLLHYLIHVKELLPLHLFPEVRSQPCKS